SQHLLEDVEALHEEFLFLLAALEGGRPLVQIAVLAYLVTAPDDLLAESRVVLDDPPGNEDAGLEVVAVQQVEDARHARLGPVRCHRHVEESIGERRVALEPGRFTVEVEGHHDGAAGSVGPGDGGCHDAREYTSASMRCEIVRDAPDEVEKATETDCRVEVEK